MRQSLFSAIFYLVPLCGFGAVEKSETIRALKGVDGLFGEYFAMVWQ